MVLREVQQVVQCVECHVGSLVGRRLAPPPRAAPLGRWPVGDRSHKEAAQADFFALFRTPTSGEPTLARPRPGRMWGILQRGTPGEVVKKTHNARPLPSGRGRKLDWTSVAGCYDEESRPHTAWLWQALAHWTAEHGDPETGCQPRNETVGKWVGVGASAVTAWRKGQSWNLTWFAVVRDRVGCAPATCASPYADQDELSRRLEAADQEQKAHRRSALLPVARSEHRALTRKVQPVRPPARAAAKFSAPDETEEIRLVVRKVDLADRRTVRAWEAVVPLLDDPDRTGVHLRDVYVTRKAQKVVVKGLRNQLANRDSQGNAVLGEPGTGKSCVLWGVREELRDAGWMVVAISAAALLGTPGHPADLKARELLAALKAKVTAGRGRQGAAPATLLLDTADLLLHDDTDEGRDLLVALIQGARALGMAVAIACRSVEARRLEEREQAGLEALLSKEHLEGYDDGRTASNAVQQVGAPWEPGSELDHAVEAYLRVFCCDPGLPSPREGGGHHQRGPAEPLAQRMRSTLVYAAARGLPLGQLIRHPLSLRMLFDIHAPAGPRDSDLDVTDLFLEYWAARVTQDIRHAVFGDEPTDDEARWDLSEEVRALGLAMLREGKPELRRADAVSTLVAQTALQRPRAGRAVSVLLRRGVLRKVEGGRLAFHHQAFAEHAAGQALRFAARGLVAAADRVTDHPDDLLLAEAVRHAFHIADRDGAAGWYPALDKLMRHDHAATRLTALRIHAGLRHPSQDAVATAVEALRDADPWQTTSYITVLTGTSNPGPAAWPRTLRAIWDREERQDRRRVLIAVTHLAYQQPAEVAAFLSGLGLLEFEDRELLDCLPFGRDLTLLFLGLHTAAPDKCMTALTKLLDAAVAARSKPVLRHTLTALSHLAAEDPTRYGEHAANLPALLDGLRERAWQASLDRLIPVAAPAWATGLQSATIARVEEAVRCVAHDLSTGTPGPSAALRLRALADVLATRPSRPVQRFLHLLADAAGSPESAEHIAKYLLAPLLLQKPARRGVAAARDWCRDHLSPTQDLDVERGITGVIAKALDRDKVPLPAEIIAACLWQPRDPERLSGARLRRWLSAPWPHSLTVAAAAGRHPVAERALDLHVTTAPPATDAYAVRLREALGRRAADHPDRLLGPLQEDAVRSGDLTGLRRLALLGPEMLAGALEDPGHRETLIAMGKVLQASPAGLKAVGLRLEMLAATRGGLLPATVEETLAWLTATRNGEVQKTVLKGINEQLHQQAELWCEQDPLARLAPILRAVEDRGREIRETAGPSYDHHSRQFMLAANEAYLLRIALHAHFDDIESGPVDEILAPLRVRATGGSAWPTAGGSTCGC
ncbi:hypothetical protein [Streptomyces sp. NPDC090057]|uniref:hypothetical protein n=1 Tax=Streptomyces sp. NPDC090057 TaxID=3365935 RepID=UPI0037F1ED6C